MRLTSTWNRIGSASRATLLAVLVAGAAPAALGQEVGPQGPPDSIVQAPDFSNNPYLGQRMHLDAAVHYEEATLQTRWDWPATLEYWLGRIDKLITVCDTYDHLYFVAPAPAILDAVAPYQPKLIDELRKRVEAGRMEVTGGRWIESDLHMITEESHVRQLIHGQRFYEKTLGRPASIAWQTDGRGYPANYPQLLALAGMDRMLLKTEDVEGDRFLWQGLDGTQVLAVNRPYPFEITNEEDDRRHKSTPPKVNAGAFFAQVELERSALPIHTGELLGDQTGRYTAHGDIKEWMRAAESALLSAESLATVASLHGYVFPQPVFDDAWEKLMFHQQHEILGGVGIGAGYDYSEVVLHSIREKAEWITATALRHVGACSQFIRPEIGVVVGNPVGFRRDDVVAVALDPAPSRRARYRVTRSDGGEVAYQAARVEGEQRLLFRVADVPAFGWDTYRIRRLEEAEDDRVHAGPAGEDSVECRSEESAVRIENGMVRVLIDKTTGDLVSVFDKQAGREVMHGGRTGNRLIAYLEHPHKRSAKFIGEIDGLEPVTDRIDTTIIERGPLRGTVRMTHRYRDSIIQQFIRLTAGSARIDFETQIDWNERGSERESAPMLRAAFPLVPGGEGTARYGVPFGDVERPADGAEVPAMHWAMRRGDEGGAAILTTSRHGFHADDQGMLMITLVRTPYQPDPLADVHDHRFTYSLLPVLGKTTPASLTRAAIALNQPVAAELHPTANRRLGVPRRKYWNSVPERFGAIEWGGLDAAVPTVLTRGADGKDVMLRFFLAGEANAVGRVRANFPVRGMTQLDLRANVIRVGGGELDPDGGTFNLGIRGYEIRTCRFDMFEEKPRTE